MTMPHPNKMAAEAYFAQQKEIALRAEENAKEFMRISGAKVLHLRPITVAYIPDRRDVLFVSTAICAPGDQYSKKVGRQIALENLRNDQNIKLRKPNKMSAEVFLGEVFGRAALYAEFNG